MQPQIPQAVKVTGDTTALAALAGWFVGVLPTVATLITVLWFGILITEKLTGKPFHELVRCAYRKVFPS